MKIKNRVIQYIIVAFITIELILVLLGILAYSIFLAIIAFKYLYTNLLLSIFSLFGSIIMLSIFIGVVKYLSEKIDD